MRKFTITPRMSNRIASVLLLTSLVACTPNGDKPGVLDTDNIAHSDVDNFCDHGRNGSAAIASDDDLYANFAALQAAEPNGYSIVTRDIDNGNAVQSQTLIFTPHGGGIEPGSTEIADAIADAASGADYDYYSFTGIKSSNNGTLHITSTNFDEPTCESMVAASNRTIGIHGCSGNTAIVYVGGRDSVLRTTVATALSNAGFTVSTNPPSDLAGMSTSNICNRNSIGMGVQLEISKGMRLQMMTSLNSASGRATTKTTTFYSFVNAVRSAL